MREDGDRPRFPIMGNWGLSRFSRTFGNRPVRVLFRKSILGVRLTSRWAQTGNAPPRPLGTLTGFRRACGFHPREAKPCVLARPEVDRPTLAHRRTALALVERPYPAVRGTLPSILMSCACSSMQPDRMRRTGHGMPSSSATVACSFTSPDPSCRHGTAPWMRMRRCSSACGGTGFER